jgi:cytochrome c oxidase subunit 3
MVFAAFTGAYLARRGIGQDWRSTPMPPLVWINSAIILASSGALEIARIALKSGRRQAFNRWWTAGTFLGIAFLLGQVCIWRQMHAAGIYASTNPSSGFFFLLTAAHAVHLLAAATALVWVGVCALRFALGPARRTGAEIAALFWHFLCGLWIYLLLLFSWLG